ncbi:hypothetical protein ACFXPY_21125 [Streptomyces sp. NPDC059153]
MRSEVVPGDVAECRQYSSARDVYQEVSTRAGTVVAPAVRRS